MRMSVSPASFDISNGTRDLACSSLLLTPRRWELKDSLMQTTVEVKLESPLVDGSCTQWIRMIRSVCLTGIAKRQSHTAGSSTEAEIIALNDATNTSACPVWDMAEAGLNRKVGMKLATDSQAAIQAITKGYSSSLRSITRMHGIRLSRLNEFFHGMDQVELVKVCTKQNAADALTKALSVGRIIVTVPEC